MGEKEGEGGAAARLRAGAEGQEEKAEKNNALAHNLRGIALVAALLCLHHLLQPGLVPVLHGVLLLGLLLRGVNAGLARLARQRKVVPKLALCAALAHARLEKGAQHGLGVHALGHGRLLDGQRALHELRQLQRHLFLLLLESGREEEGAEGRAK